MKLNDLVTEFQRSSINLLTIELLMNVNHLATKLQRLQIHPFLNRILNESDAEV